MGFAARGLPALIFLAAAVGLAQEPRPLSAPAEIEEGTRHPLIATPRPLSAVRIRLAPSEGGKVPGQDQRPAAAIFPPNPVVRTSCEWPSDCHGRYYLLCHDPLYLEDIPLERYGHETPWLTQPAASAARFCASVPLMPIKWAVHQCCADGWCRDCYGNLRPGYAECDWQPLRSRKP